MFFKSYKRSPKLAAFSGITQVFVDFEIDCATHVPLFSFLLLNCALNFDPKSKIKRRIVVKGTSLHRRLRYSRFE